MMRALIVTGVLLVGILAGQPVHAETAVPPKVWQDQKTCEADTHMKCAYIKCDVPAGKTEAEACGEYYKKGWQPVYDQNAPAPGSK